jgi:hypothetical protein
MPNWVIPSEDSLVLVNFHDSELNVHESYMVALSHCSTYRPVSVWCVVLLLWQKAHNYSVNG